MSEVKVDTISERTTDAGVTVEGVKIEDGIATFQTAAGSPLVFEGATANLFETTFAITDPTADRTITFPDADVTLGAAGANTPSFGAYQNANLSLTDVTWTPLQMDTEEWNVGSGFNFGTYTFTVPTDEGGKYFFSATVTYTDVSTTGQDTGEARLAIYKGASAFKQVWLSGVGGRSRYRGLSLSCVLDLSATNTVSFRGYAESNVATANAMGGQSMTFCTGFKLL